MKQLKRIALVAHDNRKQDLLDWVVNNQKALLRHQLVSTGTTGRLIEETLKKQQENGLISGVEVEKLKSGPLGGDQQLGALIAEEKVDLIVFLWDPMQPQPHDVDVKALLRIATLYNIPTACNRATADFIISSPLLDAEYTAVRKDYSAYINRVV